MLKRGQSCFCVIVAAMLLASTLLVLPEDAVGQVGIVTNGPKIFIPNGKAAELLIDGQDNVYVLHCVNGDVFFRKYNSTRTEVIPDVLLYADGLNEFVDAVWGPSGNIHLAWSTDFFSGMSVMYAKVNNTGAFIVAPTKVSANNTDDDTSVSIAVNSMGEAFLMWNNQWGPSWDDEDVMYAKIDADGSVNFTQQYVTNPALDTEVYPKKGILVDGSDNVHMLYLDESSGSGTIRYYYKKFASDGVTVLVSEKWLGGWTFSTWSTTLEMRLDSLNEIVVAFGGGVGSIETYYTKINLTGDVIKDRIPVSDFDGEYSRLPYVVLDAYDNSHIFYTDRTGTNDEIYYSALNQTGSLLVAPTRMTTSAETENTYYMGAVFNSRDICIWSYFDGNGTYIIFPLAGPPETTLVIGTPRYGSSPTFVTGFTPFSFVVQDNSGVGIRDTYYQLDAWGWVNYSSSGPFVVPWEGYYTIRYYSVDLNNTTELTRSHDIVVDNTPPTSSATAGAPQYTFGQTWITSSSLITLTATDGGTIPVGLNYTEYRVWNGGSWTGWSTYVAPFPTGPLEGPSYVEFYSSDFLWNDEAILNASYVVDNSPPMTQLDVGLPNYTSGPTWITSSTSLTLTATDGGPIPVGIFSTSYRIWQGGSWGSWQDYSTPFTLTSEGTAYVEYYSVDLLNNTEATNNATLIVDNTPPTTQLTIGAPNHTATNTWVTSSTPITLTAADGGPIPVGLNATRYRVWAGSWGPWQQYTVPFTLTTEGVNMVEYYSDDLLGNDEFVEVQTLIVDDTPPSTSFVVGQPRYRSNPSLWWNVTSATPLALSAQDGGPIPVGIATMECRILPSPTWVDCSAPFDLSGQGEGHQRIEFRSTDMLGNTEAGIFTDLIVDDSPPYSTLVPGLPQYVSTDTWVTSNTQFDILSPDDGSPPVGTNYTLYRVWNSGSWSPWLPYSSPFSLGQSEGYSYVEYYAMDLVTNQETVVNESFIVDNSPPTTSVQVGQPNYTHVSNVWVTSSTQITLTAVDGGTIPVGLGVTQYRIWAGSWGPWQDYTAPFNLDTEGLNLIEYYSEDTLGNSEFTGVETLLVDNTPPTTAVAVGGPKFRGTINAHWNVTSASTFALESSDGGVMPVGVSDVEVFIDDIFFADYTGEFSLVGYGDGVHKIDFRATDNLGNQEIRLQAYNTIYVNLDNTPPVTIIDPEDLGYDELCTLLAEDGNGSGVRDILFKIDDGEWRTYFTEFSIREYGSHTIYYKSVDNLGNEELPNELQVHFTEPVENLKPLISLVFFAILLIAGLFVARNRPIRLKTGESSSKTFLLTSLPFCIAELLIGIVSLITGLLSVPPLLGVGTFLNTGILIAGLAVLATLKKHEEPEDEDDEED